MHKLAVTLMSNNELLGALSAAAQTKGAPLSDSEKHTIVQAHENEKAKRSAALTREKYSARFLKVIRGAGYPDGTHILNEYLDKYMEDLVSFDKMLTEYEERQAKGEDD